MDRPLVGNFNQGDSQGFSTGLGPYQDRYIDEATHIESFSDEDEPEVDLGNITNSYTIEPTSIAKALSDSYWVEAMQEELLQFKLQQVWILVDLPNGKKAIGTKWVFRNKKDERGIVIRNKARIEAIRLFLAYASFMGFLVLQDEFERVLWGDLKVMFEPDKRSDVWRILQGYRVTIWKLIDSSRVHFVRFENVHIFMLVEKRYPLTPITITNMLNKKLQTDHQNEMLPNATIFEQLTLMGYENLTQKLTFYKAFFSPQWKFLIHTILQCLSAKTTAWNEFSSTMASAVICLATNQKFNFSKYIFDNMVKNLEGGVKFLMYPRFVQVFLDKQVEGMSKHKEIYVTPSHTKKVFANMKRQGKDFSSRDTPLFPTMIVQAQEQVGEGSEIPTDSHHTPTTTQPSTSKPQKKYVPTHSNDPLLSGEDRLKLNELMELCTSLSQRVLDLEKTKTSQAAEITKLKERVKKLEKKGGSRTHRLRRLYKVGRSARVVSFEDEGLGDQEDASKQGRKIDEIDQDAEVTLIDETQGRYGDNLMFDIGVLDNEQDMAEKEVDMAKNDVSTDDRVTTAGEVVTTANVVTLIEIKAAKPKARGVIVQEPSEFKTTTSPSQPSQLPQAKDKGKAKMVEPEKALKKKDQIMFDKELAARLQAEEQGELTIEEKSRLFVELMNKRKKHFARLRAEEQRRKPPTKAQKRNTMSTYLKNMAAYKHNQLKTKSFEDIQMLFDKEMKRVNTFVDMDTELVKGSETRIEGSSKRAREELESENLMKKELDENVEAKVDDDQEVAEMKKHMEIVPDDEVAIDVIPLATKTPIIVDRKIIKEGKMGYFQIIRVDGSSKRYSSMIQILQNINRENLETLWKLVKAKHGLTRLEEGYERVL
ncbi:hypothetical protein Tco_0405364 [Tanacetum coccineum]